jgi:2'-5' RNA ligase
LTRFGFALGIDKENDVKHLCKGFSRAMDVSALGAKNRACRWRAGRRIHIYMHIAIARLVPSMWPIVFCLMSCASVSSRGGNTPQANRCNGGINYGSGMVATPLPPDVASILGRVHDNLGENYPSQMLQEALTQAPYSPHISLIYGVAPEHLDKIVRELNVFVDHPHLAHVCIQKLVYWDDPINHKTTLAVALEDSEDGLEHLHDKLAAATQIKSRFAYHPHVTLAFLDENVRLSMQTEQQTMKTLRAVCWRPERFYVTDACGVAVEEIPKYK